mmetsp:Transcript_71690/g.205748  ORF Transcript_71690/g.205748 Transcript_71690/m.205748 type:complete len:512 (-) Transcript_71690:68-1603(-)
MDLLDGALVGARRRPWLALGASSPVITLLMLLWVDEFNLRGAFSPREERVAPGSLPVVPAGGPMGVSGVSDVEQEHFPINIATTIAGVAVAAASAQATRAPRLEALPLEDFPCKAPARVGRPSARSLRGDTYPKVGASITLHSPKYHAAGKWLDQYSSCPGAVVAMSVLVVFTSEAEMTLFRQSLACIYPDVPEDAWTGVVALPPYSGWKTPAGAANQLIAAYKKWFGIAHMMDLEEQAPEYGLMVDSELLVFDRLGEDGDRGLGCAIEGPWSRLYARIQAFDESKSFPAARVSRTLTTYKFGSFTRSGADYDRTLIIENAHFAGYTATCETEGCQEVKRQIDLCLFSWWTDVPWVNLRVASRMLIQKVGRGLESFAGSYRRLATGIKFTRFEHLSYQQWCAMHEGFNFRDVTDITGEAKWGSYMEDPLPGARLAELKPVWISGEALERVENGQLPPMNVQEPPLLIFHADKGRSRANREANRERWKHVLKESVRVHGKDRGWDAISQEDW